MSPEHNPDAEQSVEVDGRRLRLRRLDKVLYPATGTTKAEVIDYYVRVAGVLLPQLAGRPVTRIRWPDGVESSPFFEKNVPSHTPEWLPTVELPAPGSTRGRERITYPLYDSLAALVWSANLAALELHVPQWQVGPRGGVRHPTRLVVDLDPGAPAGLAECAAVAALVRERLGNEGLDCFPVTSGSKGLQLYAPLAGRQDADAVREYARTFATQLSRDHRDLVVSNMSKAVRPGKVLLDWSQNHAAKTTICPYSLRGRSHPWVAAPRTWAEIEDGEHLGQLESSEVLARLAAGEDHGAGLLKPGPSLHRTA